MNTPVFVIANTIEDAYFQLMAKILMHGEKYEITNGSHAGDHRYEFTFASGFIRNPHIRPLAPILSEAASYPRPTSDGDIEAYFANYLMDPDLADNEEYKYAQWINGWIEHQDHPIIGKRWEQRETMVEWIIRHFKEKGHGNNHCFINVGENWQAFNYDIPWENETDRRTSPCLRGIDFKIKQGQLITSVTFRSWDLYGGFPENMGGFTLLNEYVAEELGIDAGPLAFSSAGLHCYGHQIDVVKQIIGDV